MKIPRVVLPTAVVLFSVLLGCGTDETAPGNPSTTAPLPDVIFFNDTSATVATPEIVLFEGVARDNVQVKEVALSFNGGAAPWHVATLTGFGTSVGWHVSVQDTELPAGPYDMVIRVTDGEENATLTSSHPVTVVSGDTFADLQSKLAGATAGDTIYLSSGRGYAYGNSLQAGALAVTVPLTLVGTGYVGPKTIGGYIAVGSTPGTILEVDNDAPRLLSVSSDLSLSGVRLKGGGVGIDLPDAAADVSLEVKNCLFEGQENWAIRAADSVDADTLGVSVSASILDVSAGSEVERGGMSLTRAQYALDDVEVLGFLPVLGEVGLDLSGGAGQVTNCLFERNSLAMSVSDSSPVISSCAFTGDRNPSSGLEFANGTGSPVIRHCSLTNFAGSGAFAVRAGGSTKPVFYRNTVTGSYKSNGAVGILVDGSGALPDLGTWPFDESGYNQLTSPGLTGELDYVIYVADATSGTAKIMAGRNYWGKLPDFDPTFDHIHTGKVFDGHDPGNTGAASVYLSGLNTAPNTADLWNGL